MPCLVMHFRPEVQVVKRFVDGGELVRVYFCKTGWLRAREAWSPRGWWYEPYRACGGAFLTLGSALLYGVAKRNAGALTIAQITDSFYRADHQGREVELWEGVSTSAGS